jgi:hypothetical protein
MNGSRSRKIDSPVINPSPKKISLIAKRSVKMEFKEKYFLEEKVCGKNEKIRKKYPLSIDLFRQNPYNNVIMDTLFRFVLKKRRLIARKLTAIVAFLTIFR